MPNRIIKESAFESDRISRLSDFEFRLWVGLIVSADDAGRGDARPAIIKGHVFPLRERVTIKDIDAALHALAAAGCVSLYTVGGKPYYEFPNWSKHQRVRDVKPKFPPPDEADEQSAAVCGELRRTAANCGLESESNPNTNTNTKDICAEPQRDSAPPVVSIVLNNGSLHPVHQDQIDRWQELYPAVDVLQELRKMAGWAESNPQKRKTARGINAFITSWLAREQDKGGKRPQKASGGRSDQDLSWMGSYIK